MKKSRTERKELQEQSPWTVLEELAREGAREMLGKAMELGTTGGRFPHADCGGPPEARNEPPVGNADHVLAPPLLATAAPSAY